jgi:uncharacterized repeat protein (TIGR02543 family)
MQSTGKRALAFALVGCLSLSMCLGGRVSPAVAADASENSPAAAQPAATQADSVTTAGQPATAQDQPATTEGQPATTAQGEPATTADQPAKPSMTTQSEGSGLAPAAVGDTFTSTISVGGTDVPCVYKVLTESGSTGTVQIGDGTSPAISKSASGDLVIPATVTNGGVTYSVTALGDDCFSGCSKLTSTGLAHNATVKTLGDSCYFGCDALKSTGLEANDKITSVGDACFCGCSSLDSTGLSANSTVISLGSMAFGGSGIKTTGLESNTSVVSLDNSCFANCDNLVSTGLGANTHVLTVGAICFANCDGLVDTGLATNSTVTSLGRGCFMNCTALVDGALGSVVEDIDVLPANENATFSRCAKLQSVCYYGAFLRSSLGALTLSTLDTTVPVVVYRLSEATGWTGKSAADLGSDVTSIKSLSRLSIVGGSTSSTPTQNHWTTLAGTASNGRWVEGDKVQLSATVPAGSSFVKWVSTDPTGSFDDATSATATYTVGQSDGAETATLTAETAASSYVVHFDANGGSGSMADESMTYGVAANLTTSSFTRSGYAFAGWNTKEDGTGTSYADGQSVEDLDISGTTTVTLYAQWKAQHKVTYSVTGDVPAGYSVPVDDNAYVKGDSVTVAAVPSESGYTFSGWTVDGKEASSFTMDDSDVTVEGVWSKNAEPTTGTPDDTGSTGSGSNGTGSNGTVATVSPATSGSGDATTAVTPRTGDANGPAVGLLLVGIALAALGIASRRRSGESSR